MLSILAKLFIKNRTHYTDSSVRHKYGILCGILGIFFNLILSAAKITAGLLSKSMAIFTDGFNNLSDAASSLVTVIGFKLASKKPDSEHPFGHGRLEYVAGLIIAFLILLMGVELFKSSVVSIFEKKSYDFTAFSFAVMILSILVKLYMYFYNHNTAKKIDSVALEAAAKDSLSDIISTSLVIFAMIFSDRTTLPLDSVAGLIVALFILKTGWEAAKETIDPLLGNPPSQQFVHAIEEEIASYPEILGFHDLLVHDYGPGRLMISLHAEVPGNKNVFEMHDVVDAAENSIAKKLNCNVVIHMDPVDLENTRLAQLKELLSEELAKIDSSLKFHDLRYVPGLTHSKLIFDVVKPFDLNIEEKMLRKKLRSAFASKGFNINFVIKIETPMND